jgi:Cdc6-like AAA superfamily ATPase
MLNLFGWNSENTSIEQQILRANVDWLKRLFDQRISAVAGERWRGVIARNARYRADFSVR